MLSQDPDFDQRRMLVQSTDHESLVANRVDGSRFWAVIIAIDDYKTSPLRGCISDAKMVAEYLRDGLHVPESHIQLLLSPSSLDIKESTVPGNKLPDEPTHSNIVQAILDLSTNPGIQHGDNIIIYFAGCGTTYKCADHSGYKDNSAAQLGKIDALCPVDRGRQHNASDPQVPDISDREINTILAEIARNKGNHITFILDCSFSASLTRAPKEGVRRSISPLPSSSIPHMFVVADETLEKHVAEYKSISAVDWEANTDSHVILAACKEYEEAKEVEEIHGFNGVFTRALISALKNADSNGESMTYYELIGGLELQDANQHPVIAGNKKHRAQRLWFQDHHDTKSDV